MVRIRWKNLVVGTVSAVCCIALLSNNRAVRSAPPAVQAVKPASSGKPTPRAAESDRAPNRLLFEKDVRPILKSHCGHCHGKKTRKASLNLTSLSGVFKGGESGKAIVPGDVPKSLLYERLADGGMPPDDKDPLTKSELAIIRRWIRSGARSGAKRSASGQVAESDITQHDVIPILLLHCSHCHGAARQEAGLDLRTKAALLTGGKSGPTIVLGHPEQSLLVTRIHRGEMPPKKDLLNAGVKPVSEAELQKLIRWIKSGAPEVPLAPDVAGTTADPLVSAADRKFWSFQPTRAVAVPAVQHVEPVRNPVDAFILKKLEQQGLTFSPEADRATLIRRATFDLTGLPPTLEETTAFVSDPDPAAYEKLIDHLLASPRYGERWGRHWLDAAGYADSWGKLNADVLRPDAWRYRDYVIRAFNADKPYDRFLLEQIAGDELVDYRHAQAITEEMYDDLVATGFLRMGPDGTMAREVAFVTDRLETIADEINIFSSTVMGLTMKCARCHSHKYDPIPQRDYYRLAALFRGAFDEYDWLKPAAGSERKYKFGLRLLPFVTTAERKQWLAHNRDIDRRIDALRKILDHAAAQLRSKILEQRLARLPNVLRADLRKMLATPPKKRDAVLSSLAKKFETSLRISSGELQELDPKFRKVSQETEKQIKALKGQKLAQPMVQALWDRGNPSPAYLYRRGDPTRPGPPVRPGVPAVLSDPHTPFVIQPPFPGGGTGRRLALARWLVRPDHPLTARVMVNRIWKHHFGSGIVKTLGDFGHTGARPSHPQLLDWLAREFVGREWSFKAMHRLMMTSATYRQLSLVTLQQRKLDPDNMLLSRMPMHRLDAEELRDAILSISGRMDDTPFGRPEVVLARKDGLVTAVATDKGFRRSVYVQQRRTEILTMLKSFDLPNMAPNCMQRSESTVAPQALFLMNNRAIDRLADHFAERVLREVGPNPGRQIDRTYLIALSREPTREERTVGLQILDRLTRAWQTHQKPGQKPGAASPARRALAIYCHALLNSNAFIYID